MRDGGHYAASLWRRLESTHLAPIELRVRARCPLPVDGLRGDLDPVPESDRPGEHPVRRGDLPLLGQRDRVRQFGAMLVEPCTPRPPAAHHGDVNVQRRHVGGE